MVIVAVLLIVTWPKLILGARLSDKNAGSPAVPVTANVEFVTETPSLKLSWMVSGKVPAEVGAKLISRSHELPAASVTPQVPLVPG